MHNAVQLFDAVKTTQAIESDYKLAQVLGVTKAAISAVRSRGGSISDETAVKIAELTGLPADYCVACAHAERASERTRGVWERIAKKAAGAAVAVLIGAGLLPYSDAPPAGERAGGVGGMYIMLNRLAALFFGGFGLRKRPFLRFCACR